MKLLLRRVGRCVFGLALFSFGSYLCIPADIGLAPWSAFSMGVAGATGLSYGDVSLITSVVILGIDLALKEKIGIATLLDAMLVGKLVDLFLFLNWVPRCESFLAGLAVLFTGQLFLSVGSYFYISPGLGCGPRDSLMVAVGKRLPRVPIGVARGLIEGSALAVGWFLGAKVGLGTVISVFGISIILQYTFKAFHFDVKAVRNEGVIESLKAAAPDRMRQQL